MSVSNILLVDDDKNLANTLSGGLRKAMGEAISITACYGGSEALSILATQAFDMVISDFNMPDMGGIELLDKVRQDHPNTFLVLITAYGTEVVEEEMHRLGIGYLAKPFDLPCLVHLIQDLTPINQQSINISSNIWGS
jgi:CheY-like chemotaxis protein